MERYKKWKALEWVKNEGNELLGTQLQINFYSVALCFIDLEDLDIGLNSGLFFEHFEKTQGLPEKNSSLILGKKLKVVESTKDFGQKTQGKLTIRGKFLEEAVEYWSLLFLNWPSF